MTQARDILITGPTATGKTKLALMLARDLNAGIISADSIQVYRHVDILSAKPSVEERKIVPHLGIDIVEPTENFSVVQWLKSINEGIHKQTQRWLIVGGSGLYVKAFLHGMDDLPISPPELKKKWESVELKHAAAELQRREPKLAAKLDLSNKRRVVRALILLDMGIIPTQRSFLCRSRDVFHIHLVRSAEDLHRRIRLRTQKMFDLGVVEEFRRLIDMGLSPQHTAWQAIGMKELSLYHEGLISLERTIELITAKTWQFSRRQRTWFNSMKNKTVLIIDPAWDEMKTYKEVKKIICGFNFSQEFMRY